MWVLMMFMIITMMYIFAFPTFIDGIALSEDQKNGTAIYLIALVGVAFIAICLQYAVYTYPLQQ
jgi:hypothetical protein